MNMLRNSCPRVFVWLLVLLPVLACGDDSRPKVRTAYGEVIGLIEDQSKHFRGIPYAQPPVGTLRWQPPREPEAWTQPRDATQFGPNCPQKSEIENTREDCLTLNVSTPIYAQADEKLPVLVWIHGGGLVAGSGSSSYTQGRLWNKEGIILVTINYRLGALGFFAHKALDSSHGANYGLMDMVAALKWVKGNIANFGGDPGRITIMGASAGGMAVQLLMVTPEASGLFNGGIAESGYGTWPKPRTKPAPPLAGSPSAEEIANTIVKRILGRDAESVTLEQLQQITPEQWVNSINGFHLPIVDGITLPEESAVLFSRGRQHPVTFISGGTSFDGSVFPYSGLSQEDVMSYFRDDLDEISKLYDLHDPEQKALGIKKLFGDMRYLIAARYMTQHMAKVQRPGYLYMFDYLPSEKRDALPGAPHVSEIDLLFNQDTNHAANLMRQYWINFIKTGNPNGPDLLGWPAYDEKDGKWMVFRDEPVSKSNVRKDKLDVLEELYLKRVNLLE